MKRIITSFMIFSSLLCFSQENTFSKEEIKVKLDSIKKEGNLLYSLEYASWTASDIIIHNKKLKNLYGSYLSYQADDLVKTIFLNKKGDMVIAEFSFTKNLKQPISESTSERNLTENEIALKTVQDNVIAQLSDPKYEVGVPNGYSLNFITIPFGDKFKTYIVTGATETGVIPFGNDYLFISNKQGQILESKKFHSRLIPTFTSIRDSGDATSSMHSHMKTSPFVSATDICTFKLYAPFTKLEKFSVYSPALKVYLEYNYKTDILDVKE